MKIRIIKVFLILFSLNISGVQAGPAIQNWETSNGTRVYFVPAPELPMVDLRVVFDAGSARDGEQWGLASMTNSLLSEGSSGFSAEQISEWFEDVGAQFGSGVTRDMAFVSLRSIIDDENLKTALTGLEMVLGEPDFPASAFERQKKRHLIALKKKKQSPGAVAEDAFYEAVYGDHPYAHPVSGTVETMQALTRDRVGEFYKKWYTAKNATIAIVGDLDQQRARELAEALASQLPEGEKAPALPEVAALNEARTIRIDFPSSQSHIRIGQPGMKRGDKDYFSLYLGNHSLGGSGLVSRLSDEVREKRGLSYSVYSYFAPMAERGPFIAGLQTRNEQVDEALKVLHDTITDYVRNGQTEQEFTASRKNITGGFPLRIDNNKKIVEYLAMIGFYGLPLDYLDAFIPTIDSLNLKQSREAVSRRLDPEKMVTVIVGGQGKKDQAGNATRQDP